MSSTNGPIHSQGKPFDTINLCIGSQHRSEYLPFSLLVLFKYPQVTVTYCEKIGHVLSH